MEIQDFADPYVLFSKEEENDGSLICRKCGKSIKVNITFKSFIFLVASKVSLHGVWCNHSDLRTELNSLINASLASIENEGYI